jgi:protein TonB
MEAKKSPKADLESKKTLFLEIGLTFALAVALLAFNWKSYEKKEATFAQGVVMEIPEETIIQTQENTPPPPPPEPEVQMSEDIQIVEDDVEIKNELVIQDANDLSKPDVPVVKVEIQEEEEVVEEEIFTIVEEQPSFPGGEEKLFEYLYSNIKYPQVAKENGITGRVFLTFVVEKDGSIANPKVMRDIGGGCGQEALRVVKNMPKWSPGKQRGKPVRVQFNLPVVFDLQ